MYLRESVRADLFAVSHVAGQQQDLGGGEGGGQRQTVLLLADLLPVGVHPLLENERKRAEVSFQVVGLSAALPLLLISSHADRVTEGGERTLTK